MRPWFGAALLLAISTASLCGQVMPSGPETLSTLGVYLEFTAESAETAVIEMKREASAILSPAGLKLEWRLLAENRGSENFNEVAVMQFHGACDGSAAVLPPAELRPLGEVQVADGHVLPFGKIECDQVRKIIAGKLAAASPEPRQNLFGRALGRVLAHELYHILARTMRHAASGVAKPYYSPFELLADALAFRAQEIQLIRKRVGRDPIPSPAGSLAAAAGSFPAGGR